ncbi:hypothetical protein VHEMI08546 [[Torrubiella] hemipterigena]|uniref:Peptide hydrolase n=1 Tax=[Torrubiella] hemipterigena TaxID=1531966 RepID=A0A0A1TDT6_9HYPO|nr:hypothetical protein VHEMI08546 [[Torrubiella] hemipterigena]
MANLNPFAFRPGPVSFWSTVVYFGLILALIYVHETVPSPPAESKLPAGVNLTAAWADLQAITKAFHPFNTHENDDVRDYIISRSKDILDKNGVKYTVDQSGGVVWPAAHVASTPRSAPVHALDKLPGVTLFDDQVSNVTFTDGGLDTLAQGPLKIQYFEGNNFYAYIHGKKDPEGDWWHLEGAFDTFQNEGGVLLSCHFDSVSTGYGATDDGMSCVSLLQLLDHFTTDGNQPNHGIVILFNNAEEDGLLGARAFGYSPILKLCHTFINLEGAGAGGRAMLFRTTDLETAQAYGVSPHPFGSVIAADAFKRGIIQSGTDYQVFASSFGQRGLDVAFYTPRSRYHTEDDDTRHTSTRSIWHMLSAALATTKRLDELSESVFSGDRSDGRKDLIQNGKSTEGVWFDFFGRAWAALSLRGLFAWTLTLLIATPLILFVVTVILLKQDKYYFFAGDVPGDPTTAEETFRVGGWRGFFRFPLAAGFASMVTIGLALLLAKVNPLVMYSSGYSVWAMVISSFYLSYWLVSGGASYVRPTALHRGFTLIWLFIITWAAQIFVAVAEDRMGLGSFYFMAFFHSSVFVALLVSLLEMFALPGRADFALYLRNADVPGSPYLDAIRSNIDDAHDDIPDEEVEPTEETPLRAEEPGYGSGEAEEPTTFTSTYRRARARAAEDDDESRRTSDIKLYEPYQGEQSWSGKLPSWTWLLQLAVLAPVHIILVGSLGLVQTAAMAQTGVDGSDMKTTLIGIATISILLLLPLTPFIHRVRSRVPTLLFLILVGTLTYNLMAFPFSVNYRFKYYFQQVIDVDTKSNTVSLYGLEDQLRQVISTLPAAAGQEITCGSSERSGTCKFDASSVPPNVVEGVDVGDLMKASLTRGPDGRSALLEVDAVDSRTCSLGFSRPVYGFEVEGAAPRDTRVGRDPRMGFTTARLWRRRWEGPWKVVLEIAGPSDNHKEPLEVEIRCAYSDVNEVRKIPAFGELQRFAPAWSVPMKYSVGLVDVRKTVKL